MKNLSLSVILIVSFCVFLHVAAVVLEKKIPQSGEIIDSSDRAVAQTELVKVAGYVKIRSR